MRTVKGRIRELTRIPSRVSFGYLAEPYDGIGQYVSVTLAKASTAAAYKARVAAGDFGGGRIFPAGTRVPVFSHRGQLEVLLGNHPQVIGCIDTFTRTVTNSITNWGWGTSEIVPLPFIMVETPGDFLVDGSKAIFRRSDDFTSFGQGEAYLPIYPTYPVTFEWDYRYGVPDADANGPYCEFFIGEFSTSLYLYYDFDGDDLALFAGMYSFMGTLSYSTDDVVVAHVSPGEATDLKIKWDIAADYSSNLTINGITLTTPAATGSVYHAEHEFFTCYFVDAGLDDGSGNLVPSIFEVDNLTISPCQDLDVHKDDSILASDYPTKWELPIEAEARFKVTMANSGVHHAFEFLWLGPSFDDPFLGYPEILLGVSNSINFAYQDKWRLVSNGLFYDHNGSSGDRGFQNATDTFETFDLTTVSNVWCRFKIRIERHTIYIKMWKDADPEPDWQMRSMGDYQLFGHFDLEAPIYGQLGLRMVANVVGSEFLVDYIKVNVGYDGQTDYVFDDFNRVVASGWGTPSGGTGPYTWEDGSSSGDSDMNVNGSHGRYISDPAAGGGRVRVAPIDWEA